jgi:hypothetical protein
MVSAGSYLLGAAQLAIVVASIAWSAYRLRGRFLPDWEGAPARLAESVIGVSLAIWLAELLGLFGMLYAGTLIASSALVAVASTFLSGGGVVGGPVSEEALATAGDGGSPATTGPAEPGTLASLVTIAVIALVFAHWGITAKRALDAGIFNFDSLWYHMPFAVDIAKGHSVTGMHYVDTVFTNWFYPQNSELLHGLGILLSGRDTLSLFLNFGWLALAFLAAWCIGRPYGRGHLTVVAAAVLLECHTLVVREPGAAKNDLMAAALLLAAIAILLTIWSRRPRDASDEGDPPYGRIGPERRIAISVQGWELAVAGLAVGLAVGTKQTALAMAAALTLAVVVLAPAGRRCAAFAWWSLAALAAGGYWYLRDLVAVGNPVPQIEGLGPISLPHPERLQTGRPDFSVAHYATDTGVWREFFAPGLHTAFGALWPLVIAAAVLGAVLAIAYGRDRALRWAGVVALLGMLAYLVTPLSAAGAEGAPAGFGINIRYAIPALLAGIVLLPLSRPFDSPRRQWALCGALLVLVLVSDRADAVLRDPGRVFAVALALLIVLVPAALLLARGRGASRGVVLAGFAALALALVAIGYPLQRHYLGDRFADEDAAEGIPGMHLESAYRWARDTEGLRIGLAGSSADFAGYGFYGTELANEVVYLGEKGPRHAFNAIPTCRAFRAAVNEADLDYLVTSPFLNFIHVDEPIPSPEARWLRGEQAVKPLVRSGPVIVWKVRGELDPSACGAVNAPLREIPDTPDS